MNADVLTLAYVMETFLTREGVRFRKSESKSTNSIYFDLWGPKRPYRLRVSDHRETKRENLKQADFDLIRINDIRAAQTSISARVIQPMRRGR